MEDVLAYLVKINQRMKKSRGSRQELMISSCPWLAHCFVPSSSSVSLIKLTSGALSGTRLTLTMDAIGSHV